MIKTLLMYVFSLLSIIVVADGNLARSGTVPTMPRRICDVEIPIGMGTNSVPEVVSVRGAQWYADARETSVTGSVFRTMSCTYDCEQGRTISALLRRRFENGCTTADCKACYQTVSQQLDAMNVGAVIIRDQTFETSNSVSRIITRGDLVRIELSLMNMKSPECRELKLGYAVPINGLDLSGD